MSFFSLAGSMNREPTPFLCKQSSEISSIFCILSFLTLLFLLNTTMYPSTIWSEGKYDAVTSKPIPILMDISKNTIPRIYLFNGCSKCPLCNFLQANTLNNSSPSDFIFCFAFGKALNLLPFIRSLRTTGSKASVCVFLDDKAYSTVSPATQKTANDCGMQIFNLGDFGVLRKPEIMSLPYYLSYFITQKNHHIINRLIIMDLFDSVFQADPFTAYLNNSYLHFSPEFRKLKKSRINTRWVKEAGMLDFILNSWKEEEVICAGYLGGTINHMIGFLYEFITCRGIVEGWRKDNIDQGTFNYLYLSGRLTSVGLPNKKYYTDDTVQHFSVSLPDYPHDEFPHVRNYRSRFNPIPIVHHYYRSKHFIKTLNSTCPRENPEWTNYASKYKP